MSRRQELWLVGLVAASVSFAMTWTVTRGTDAAATVLSAAGLVVALITLSFVVPKPAELWVGRQDELGLDDLIFYIYPHPAPPGAQQVPRDYLLQLHVAVANIGGRKAVLSSLRLDEFFDAKGQAVCLPELPIPLQAMQVDQRSGWINRERHSQLLHVLPPYLLEPDDVITLRFRARQGLDWSDRWGLQELRKFADAISRPIEGAKLTASFRRGAVLVRRSFTVSVRVLQQQEFHELLRSSTAEFTERPSFPEEAIFLE
jgi:hypothetical protein